MDNNTNNWKEFTLGDVQEEHPRRVAKRSREAAAGTADRGGIGGSGGDSGGAAGPQRLLMVCAARSFTPRL